MDAVLVKDLVPEGACPLTVSVKDVLAVNCPSPTVTVIVETPLWLGAGTMLTVRLLPLPPKVMLLVGTRPGFDEPALRLKLPGTVSVADTVNPIGPTGVDSRVLWSAIPEILGGVFTPVTVNTNESLVVKGPSFTFTVIVAVPVWLAAGVMVTVRLLPLPPKTIALGGTSPGLDETLLNCRLAADVSASPIVKGSGPAVAPIKVV